MLNQSGGIEADVTISCLKENYFRIICPAFARSHNKSHILKTLIKKLFLKMLQINFHVLDIWTK